MGETNGAGLTLVLDKFSLYLNATGFRAHRKTGYTFAFQRQLFGAIGANPRLFSGGPLA